MARVGMNYRDRLSRSTQGVTMADGVAATVSDIASWVVQPGTGIVIESPFILLMELKDSTPAHIGATDLFWFGYKTTRFQYRVTEIAAEIQYQPWSNLTIGEQQHADNHSFLVVDLGIPYLALIEGETFILRARTASATIESDNVQVYVPVTKTDPEDVAELHAMRVAKLGY